MLRAICSYFRVLIECAMSLPSSALAVSELSQVLQPDLEENVVWQLTRAGFSAVIPKLDPRAPGHSKAERLHILKARYFDALVEDGLRSGHFVQDAGGQLRLAIASPTPTVLGYVAEAYTVRMAADARSAFGRDLFKWITATKRLNSAHFEAFVPVGLAFPETRQQYPGAYAPGHPQFDVGFLRLNAEHNRPEPATLIRSNVPAGVQVKAIRGSEVSEIVEPVLAGKYFRVLTFLRHRDGIPSVEFCLREIEKRYKAGSIERDARDAAIEAIRGPEQLGLDQRDIDDYFGYVEQWANAQAYADELTIAGALTERNFALRGSSRLVSIA